MVSEGDPEGPPTGVTGARRSIETLKKIFRNGEGSDYIHPFLRLQGKSQVPGMVLVSALSGRFKTSSRRLYKSD